MRALATAQTKAGDTITGTRDALVVPGRELRWEQIHTADWDSETDTLTVMLVQPEVLTYELDAPKRLLQLIRERVTASIVLTRRKEGFTLMARRPPGGGEITLTVEYDRGVDPDDPAVLTAAQAAVREVRDELGPDFVR